MASQYVRLRKRDVTLAIAHSTPIPSKKRKLVQRKESRFLHLPTEIIHRVFEHVIKHAENEGAPNREAGISVPTLKDALSFMATCTILYKMLKPEFYRRVLFPITFCLNEYQTFVGYPKEYESMNSWDRLLRGADAQFAIDDEGRALSYEPPGSKPWRPECVNGFESGPFVNPDNERMMEEFTIHHASQIRRVRLNISNEWVHTPDEYAYENGVWKPTIDKPFEMEYEPTETQELLEEEIQRVIQLLLGSERDGSARTATILELRVSINIDFREGHYHHHYQAEAECFNSLSRLFEPLKKYLAKPHCAYLELNGTWAEMPVSSDPEIFPTANQSNLMDEIIKLQKEDMQDRHQHIEHFKSAGASENENEEGLDPIKTQLIPAKDNFDKWYKFWQNRRGITPYARARFNFLHPSDITDAIKSDDGVFGMLWRCSIRMAWWGKDSFQARRAVELLKKAREEYPPATQPQYPELSEETINKHFVQVEYLELCPDPTLFRLPHRLNPPHDFCLS